ncbi:uncharacterized protein A4U43_C04F30890 [Asparagus officinalis]|uniref:26S proteasome regulatory subunit Rpn7 N-terminal domain-containing protein n=1 Tax=Asparagus officinalis TaxID=4686 RepID=A0A5P1F6L1_ASPOF|nr:uncharacterized protein A4U43_C04F30890 [Asparagus officinalis]
MDTEDDGIAPEISDDPVFSNGTGELATAARARTSESRRYLSIEIRSPRPSGGADLRCGRSSSRRLVRPRRPSALAASSAALAARNRCLLAAKTAVVASLQGRCVVFSHVHGLGVKAWADSLDRRAELRKEKLENELNGYRTNLIKESIRMGYNDFGDFYYSHGHLGDAFKNYVRTRDYCTTSKHITQMCLNVILVSIELGQFMHVSNYVGKAEQAPDSLDAVTVAKLRCASGLAQLEAKKYKLAARKFLETGIELGNNYSEVIAPQDVGTYGGLCALASFDRTELKNKVIDNINFRNFLELVPEVRELINDFYARNPLQADITPRSQKPKALWLCWPTVASSRPTNAKISGWVRLTRGSVLSVEKGNESRLKRMIYNLIPVDGSKVEDVKKPVNPISFLLRFILGTNAATYYVLVPIYMWIKDQIFPKGMPI